MSGEIIVLDEHNCGVLFNLISIPTMIIDSEGLYFLNKALTELLGYTLDNLPISWENAVDSEQREKVRDSLIKCLEGYQGKLDREVKVYTQSGKPVWIKYYGQRVIYKDKVCVLVHLTNITRQKSVELYLSRIIKLRDSMLELSQAMLSDFSISNIYKLVLDKALEVIPAARLGTIMVANGEYLRVVASAGFSAKEIFKFKVPIKECFWYKATNGNYREIAFIDDLTQLKLHDFDKLPIPGTEEYIKSTISAPLIIDGELFGVVNVDSIEKYGFTKEDYTSMEFIKSNVEIAVARHRVIKQRIHLSKFDGLTNIYSRSYFEELMMLLLKKANRYEENIYLVMIDLDNLKFVNDTYGHIVGDKFIQFFAQECKKSIRNSDLFARYGGDEFIGAFTHSTKEELINKFEKMRARLIANPFIYKNAVIKASFSYGVSAFLEDGKDYRELVRAADGRMYQYKKKHKELGY